MVKWFINGEIGKWEIRHGRKIDKDWKGRPDGLAFAPYQLSIWAHFLALPFYHSHQFSALSVFRFTILQFLPISQYRGPSHSSQPNQSIRPSHVGNTCQDNQTSRSRHPSRYSYTSLTSLPRQASQSRPPCRCSYPGQPDKSNLSRLTGRFVGRLANWMRKLAEGAEMVKMAGLPRCSTHYPHRGLGNHVVHRRAFYRPVSHPESQSAIHPLSQSASHSVSQSTGQSANQSVRSGIQPSSQAVSQPSGKRLSGI